MREVFDRLLQEYEDGKVDRRQLLGALTALALPAAIAAQPQRYRARSVNHMNVVVSDVTRSEAFYRTLLGLPPKRSIPGDAYALDFPDGGYISLGPLVPGNCFVGEAKAGRIDHFGIGVDNFDAERVASELDAAGVEGVEVMGPSVFAQTLMVPSSSYRPQPSGSRAQPLPTRAEACLRAPLGCCRPSPDSATATRCLREFEPTVVPLS